MHDPSSELNDFSKEKSGKEEKITNFRTHRYKYLFLNRTVRCGTICEHHRGEKSLLNEQFARNKVQSQKLKHFFFA